ncbi:MAG: thiazole synthase [Planctomycetes bacterium]|nr:thiazole synthase [Planctomycetota bacterium]
MTASSIEGTPYRDGQAPVDRPLVLGGRTFTSRLFVGTGKYASFEQMRDAIDASGSECVTVAVRRLDLGKRDDGKVLLDFLDRDRIVLLPNTAGCFTADDAVRTARLGRELGLSEFVKLEVLGDPKTLLPDPVGTLEAAKQLVSEGFQVLCYTSDDPIIAKRLEDVGVAAVMPAGSPIGSGQGVINLLNLRFILESITVPVLVDAGVGTASDVAIAMEQGADGILLNTAIAKANDPVRMARAMRLACEAGRDAWLAGRMPKLPYASASSPTSGTIAQGRAQERAHTIPGE